MDLKIKLEQLHNRVADLKDQISTEEATKNAFAMPFIQILGDEVKTSQPIDENNNSKIVTTENNYTRH